jgi:hypothetical protein
MATRMIGIRISITRYVSDYPQPGIVECEFVDAHDVLWKFVEKTAIVSSKNLDDRSTYPQPGVIGCTVIGRACDKMGREIIVVSSEDPWCVESVDGSSRFQVLPTSLVEWDWGSEVEREWDGRP